MRIELDASGDKQISRRIVRIAGRAVDGRPVFELLATRFMRIEARQFSSQGRFASGGWPPLTPRTRARKREQGHDPRILHATHRLRDSLTQRSHPDQELTITDEFMVFGTRVPYARPHQRGSTTAPRRRPIELREQDRRETVKSVQLWVLRGQLR